MTENQNYIWTDNPTVSGVSLCDTDVLNDCLMHLKYNNESGNGLSLFDTIIKDHVLSYEESKGFALQGTYVYKEAAAGSRYGYPDFYAQCVMQKESGLPKEVNVGDSVLTLYTNQNGHIFYDIADKMLVDELFEDNGIADFYGVDTENERIFLPRNNYFHQFTTDITKVNEMKEAGLPNITGLTVGKSGVSSQLQGAFYQSETSVTAYNGGTNNAGAGFDASRSNPIYGNSDTVQPQTSLKLLYYVVGNTTVSMGQTEVVDITTTENDTTPLFTGLYFDFAPNHPSWLKAGMQQNSGGIYTTCYNELVNILNGQNPYNLKVVDVANLVSGTDYSEYWQVDQDSMMFRTPLTISDKSLSGAVNGNGIALGLTVGTTEYGLSKKGTLTENNYLGVSAEGLSTSIGSSVSTSYSTSSTTGVSVGLTTDPENSGIIAQESTAQLYFKVANAVENIELLNVGEVLESIAGKMDVQGNQTVVEVYSNGASWYRVWSDGWCEQGSASSGTGHRIINLLKDYKDTNYNVSLTNFATGFGSANISSGVYTSEKNISSFKIFNDTNGSTGVYWEAKGYIN